MPLTQETKYSAVITVPLRKKQLLNPNTFIPNRGKWDLGCAAKNIHGLLGVFRKVRETDFLLYPGSSMVFSMHHTNYPQDGQYGQRR
jgi:hypothetical protein